MTKATKRENTRVSNIKDVLGLFSGLTKKRKSFEKNIPNFEFRVGILTGNALGFIAKRASKRGDVHEFNHCFAALTIGNSDHESKEAFKTCPLPKDRLINLGEILLYQFPEKF